MECKEAQRVLWTDGPDAVVERHVADCPACAREAVLSRQLATALSGIRSAIAVPPPELAPALLGAVKRSPLRRVRGVVDHPRFWQGAAVAAAAAASVAGVLVARRIQRPALPVPVAAETAA